MLVAASPVFSEHTRPGGTFTGDNADGTDPKLPEEIEQVGQWIGLIARQAGLTLPLPHTLF